MKGKNALAIALVILTGLILGTLILRMGNRSGEDVERAGLEPHAGHEEGKEEAQGPRGKRLAQDGFEIELGLQEQQGSPPYFLAYVYEKEKPVSPEAVQLALEIERAGKKVQTIPFQVEGDHLRSREAIAKPHVFAIKVMASYQGKTYRWDYWLVEGGIELPPGAVEEAGIEVKAAGPAAIRTVLALPGEIQLNPRRVAHVVPRVEGVVVEVRKYLGDKVKPDEVLAVLQSRELAELTSQYVVAVSSLDLARATFTREERLWKEKISPEQDYLVAKKELTAAGIHMVEMAQKLLALRGPL